MKKISEKEFINLALEIGLLKNVIRTGWAVKGVKNPESVADHTWRMAILALVLAPQLNVDRDKLVRMTLVHDLGETFAGDIRWEKGKTVFGSQEEKHKKGKTAMDKMFADNPSFQEYLDLWQEFVDQETKEAKALKWIDKLETLIQAYEYEKLGLNTGSLQEFWDNVEKYLEGSELESYMDELKKLRKK